MGVPGTIRLADGKEYRLRPLSIADIEELARFARYQPLRDCYEATEGFDQETRKRLVDDAMDRCRSMGKEQMRDALSTIEAVRYQLWLGLREDHPEITREALGKLVTMENLSNVEEQIDQISGDADPT